LPLVEAIGVPRFLERREAGLFEQLESPSHIARCGRWTRRLSECHLRFS
jgi:hypothetical protein